MEAENDPTLRFYARNAADYAGASSSSTGGRLDMFLAGLRPGAEILELGCGNGRDSAGMIAKGFRAMPTDGIAEMAAQASQRLGMPVAVLRFEEIAAVAAFDAIWANACLLHVRRADLGGIFARVHRALRPGGVFYASFKAGEAEGHDGLGRYYNYPSKPWLRALCQQLPWQSLALDVTHGGAYDGQPTDWLHLLAVKD